MWTLNPVIYCVKLCHFYLFVQIAKDFDESQVTNFFAFCMGITTDNINFLAKTDLFKTITSQNSAVT